MSRSHTGNYDRSDLEKGMHELDPRLVNVLLTKMQHGTPSPFGNPPGSAAGRTSLQGSIPYTSGNNLQSSSGMNHHPRPSQQPYNHGMRGLSPYGPQYSAMQQQQHLQQQQQHMQQQQQHLYAHPPQGGYHQHHMDNSGGYHAMNGTSTTAYYHQMHQGPPYGRAPQQYPMNQQEPFMPYSAKVQNEIPKVDSMTDISFLSIRGKELIEFCMNMVRIDPYVSAEACKEILDQKFPELASNKYQVPFSALMTYYKSSQNCQEVPADIVIMLSTVADAMSLGLARVKRGISDDGDSINNNSKPLRVQPEPERKRKRGRPRKQPDLAAPLGNDSGEVSKSGELGISIMCNGKPGLFRLQRQTCDCFCDVCKLLKEKLGVEEIDMSPKEFERHAGMGHMKKWRSSILVNNIAYKGKHGKSLGSFLASKRIDAKSTHGIHDHVVRTYAVPPAKGVPAGVNERLLQELDDQRADVPTSPSPPAHMSSDGDEPMESEESKEADEIKMKRKVGRPRKLGLSKEAKAEVVREAQQANAEPTVSSWKLLDSLNMTMEVSFGNARYAGVLELVGIAEKEEKVEAPTSPRMPAKDGSPPPHRLADEAPSSSTQNLPKKSSSTPKSQDQGSQGGIRHPLQCNLCGGPNEESNQQLEKGYFGRVETGLGSLKSIKVNSLSTVWIHDQCARWSPEVHDPTGEGTLVGVRDAIVRGRRLKCKLCGKKGATIGCFSKRCKSSFHLPCARKVCVLKANPYFVCCQDHKADFFPETIDTKL